MQISLSSIYKRIDGFIKCNSMFNETDTDKNLFPIFFFSFYILGNYLFACLLACIFTKIILVLPLRLVSEPNDLPIRFPCILHWYMSLSLNFFLATV